MSSLPAAYLLDTTAASELTKRRPNAGFAKWIAACTSAQTFLTTITIGEIQAGVASCDDRKKAAELRNWLQVLEREYRDRILTFDLRSAYLWGDAMARARRSGRTLAALDGQIAAIATANALTVVTRNTKHFSPVDFEGLHTLNPWS